MSLPKKRKEAPRDQPTQQILWKPLELVGVLTFLNNNFDLWHTNYLDACNKTIKETNINRDNRTLYNKIQNMIKDMDEYLKTGKKSASNAIIWEEEKIYYLVKEMCDKTKGRMGNGKDQEALNRTSDGDIQMTNATTSTEAHQVQIDVPDMPFSIETVDKIYNEQMQKVDNAVLKFKEKIETKSREVRDLHEQIFKYRTKLIELIEKANNELKTFKGYTG